MEKSLSNHRHLHRQTRIEKIEWTNAFNFLAKTKIQYYFSHPDNKKSPPSLTIGNNDSQQKFLPHQLGAILPSSAFHFLYAIEFITIFLISASLFETTESVEGPLLLSRPNNNKPPGCRGSGDQLGLGYPMCCPGRNTTCRSRVPHPQQQSLWPKKAIQLESQILQREGGSDQSDGDWPCVFYGDQPIGDLVLPDLVALDPAGVELARATGYRCGLRMFEQRRRKSTKIDNVTKNFRRLKRHSNVNAENEINLNGEDVGEEEFIVFGEELVGEESPDIVEYENGRPLIRYSLLNKNLPIRIGKRPRQITKAEQGEETEEQLPPTVLPLKVEEEGYQPSASSLPTIRTTSPLITTFFSRDVPSSTSTAAATTTPFTAFSTTITHPSSHLFRSSSPGELPPPFVAVVVGPTPPILPPKVVKQPESAYLGRGRTTFYIAESEPDCFCDETCATYGDCCGDYRTVCPPVDCQTSNWSPWSECVADRNGCGIGYRERRRQILSPSENGGLKCPHLKETHGCFRECSLADIGQSTDTDITTVALILDYRYNQSRRMLLPRRRVSRKRPKAVLSVGLKWALNGTERRRKMVHKNGKRKKRLKELSRYNSQQKLFNFKHYCVLYRIDWLNRNCVNKKWKSALRPGNTICAECQPEAQFHRAKQRCASDLEDGQAGFWKLIGPFSCNGIWKRFSSQQDCSCSEHFPSLHPFLLV